jgi:HlyD family secretion protein
VEVIEGGKAKRTPVQIAAQDGRYAGIAEGLQEGAEVIVQGNYALPDGTPVKARPAAGAQR